MWYYFTIEEGIGVFCSQCGDRLAAESRFCSTCGAHVAKLVGDAEEMGEKQQKESLESVPVGSDEAPLEELSVVTGNSNKGAIDESEIRSERKWFSFSRVLPVIFPLLSIILVTIGLSYYYIQEKEINAEVLKLKKTAEESALKGEYEGSRKLLEEGISKRPAYEVLKGDLEMVDKALEFEKLLNSAGSHIQKTEFDAASKDISNLKAKLSGVHSPLFNRFSALVEEKEIKITVGTVKKELNELVTVDALAGKLSILASLPEKEATPVRTEILNKIIQISTEGAEEKLKSKQFSEAFSIIDIGLEYATNDKKLLAFKERVEQEKNGFEKAEQERIDQAMEAAAQEDLKNKTAAVDVLSTTSEVDEYGDLYLSGEVKNVATTGINSITIYYSIFDENNSFVDEGYTTVYPYYLEPGETGTFDDIYYGVYQNGTVTIDNITWYLN
jgi:hypothetical protein